MRISAIHSVLTSPVPLSNRLLIDAAQSASGNDPLARITPVSAPGARQPGLRMNDGSPMKFFLLQQMAIRNEKNDQRFATPVQHATPLNTVKTGMPVLRLAASAPLVARSLGQSNQARFMRLYASDESPEPIVRTHKPYTVNAKKTVMPIPRRRSETRRRSATDPNSAMEFDHLPTIENKNDREDSVTGSISPYVTVPIGDPLPLSRSSATLSRQDFLRRNPAGAVK
ncbi:hypothetical protein [Actimicrobium sp. CCI2.3]|uniref:hypothetical protein n=1 Tax=Actimicrobium sp. CCI2.3 TaxID=3048616 RepID=UPI002B240DB1|nr:hypothetical protein [Actimicrobium sp. CCI2.3]MEB0022035.1 hypothetical protein [Actimicrobium sp. CCI2.3]